MVTKDALTLNEVIINFGIMLTLKLMEKQYTTRHGITKALQN